MVNSEVLIVEDKQPLADMYAEWLRHRYTVRAAYTGREALDALNDDLDVVLLDRRLPDISGDEVLNKIRDRELDCSVAMVTAVSPNFDVVTMGFDDYLTKPVSRSDLLNLVEDIELRVTVDDPLRESFAVQSMQSTLVESVLQSNSDSKLAESDRLFTRGGTKTTTADIDMSQVETHALPSVVSDLADEYQTRLGYRDRFLLKWLHVVFPFFALSSVDDDHSEQCRADKTLASMYVMLLDDLGERHHDRATLGEAAKLPFPHESVDRLQSDIDTEYLEITESVWQTLDSRIQSAPRYDEIEPILRYDLRQVIHAIRYSVLVNERPEMANMAEAQAIGAHNMMMLTYADIDLAYSPDFHLSELGKLRSLLLDLQKMARIGNWITTWERELQEGDFSAGVFISAVENGIVSVEDLHNASGNSDLQEQIRDTISDAHVEEALLEQWHQRYQHIAEDPPSIASIDIEELLNGMEKVMGYHLSSRGLK